MGWDGSGSYKLPVAYFPEVAGNLVDATRYNGVLNDIAAALNNALAKDGQNAATANISLAGNRLTNVAAGRTTGEVVTYEQAIGLGIAVGVIPPLYKTANYTVVPADRGYNVTHRSTDANARTFTLQVDGTGDNQWPDGSSVTFTNWTAAVLSIAAGNTMYLAGGGSTGTRSLAQYGICTAVWGRTENRWIISGAGLT